MGEDDIQPLELFDHWRNDEIEHTADDGKDHDHGDDNRQGTHPHMKFVLHKLHHRIEQIGEEPRDEERQQHTAQIVHQQEYGQDDGSDSYPTYETIKCDFLWHNTIID